ncbi:uncharacterized protein V1518DRAFT_424040 [Limtongia smithiae]|uniref:uncharacterized protein n=1 Tax=Limtongia smithiae TaxID=1125753 RepID=UPI0034CEE4F6
MRTQKSSGDLLEELYFDLTAAHSTSIPVRVAPDRLMPLPGVDGYESHIHLNVSSVSETPKVKLLSVDGFVVMDIYVVRLNQQILLSEDGEITFVGVEDGEIPWPFVGNHRHDRSDCVSSYWTTISTFSKSVWNRAGRGFKNFKHHTTSKKTSHKSSAHKSSHKGCADKTDETVTTPAPAHKHHSGSSHNESLTSVVNSAVYSVFSCVVPLLIGILCGSVVVLLSIGLSNLIFRVLRPAQRETDYVEGNAAPALIIHNARFVPSTGMLEFDSDDVEMPPPYNEKCEAARPLMSDRE